MHTLLVPKVGVRDDLYMVEAMVNQIEQGKGYQTRVGLEALIETALGMANVETIAQFGGRLEALHFGVADYAASMRARTTNIGGLNPIIPATSGMPRSPAWSSPAAPMACARSTARSAISRDPEGYMEGARRAAALGCEGKWAIHPSSGRAGQRGVLSPPEAEVTKARRIIEELRKAEAQGKGAACLDGKMIDAASEKMARNLLVVAEAIAAKG